MKSIKANRKQVVLLFAGVVLLIFLIVKRNRSSEENDPGFLPEKQSFIPSKKESDSLHLMYADPFLVHPGNKSNASGETRKTKEPKSSQALDKKPEQPLESTPNAAFIGYLKNSSKNQELIIIRFNHSEYSLRKGECADMFCMIGWDKTNFQIQTKKGNTFTYPIPSSE